MESGVSCGGVLVEFWFEVDVVEVEESGTVARAETGSWLWGR